jgi:hypothetical protein
MRRAIVALLLIVSCATATVAQLAPAKRTATKPAAVKPAVSKQATQPDERKCIGVVSRLGETFTVKKVGIVVFQNEENEVTVDSWRLDDLVAARIDGFLKGQFAVRRIAYPQGAFASIDTPQLFRNYEAELAAIIRRLAGGTPCSRYIVVNRGFSKLGTSNQTVGGLGIVSTPGLAASVNLYALFVMNLYDGETFRWLRAKVASTGQPILFAMIKGAHREVDKSLWPDSPQIVQNTSLRDATRELVAQSVDMTLPELKPAE